MQRKSFSGEVKATVARTKSSRKNCQLAFRLFAQRVDKNRQECKAYCCESDGTLKMKLFQIQIHGIRVHANIGATLEEQVLGQSLLIDLNLEVLARLEKDLVSETLDYGAVVYQVRRFAAELGQVKLVETFAERMLQSLFCQFEAIQVATARVQKSYVPIQDFTGQVSIQMSMTKKQDGNLKGAQIEKIC